MKFRLELDVKAQPIKISYKEKVLVIGSCFTEHIGNRLVQYRFQTAQNPNGIVFNPFSILNNLKRWIENKPYKTDELFFHRELWNGWDFHGSFSGIEPNATLDTMNAAVQMGHHWATKADWIIITLGSAFVYKLKSNALQGTTGYVAANCHKVPASHFQHHLPTYAEVEACIDNIIETCKQANPGARIIFTISPVRHYREGLIENNRSKGLLHGALASQLAVHTNVFYFPAYELVIDDLRDYRFYAEDLVHPNYAATQYVWDKFVASCMNTETQAFIAEMEKLRMALNHRPMHGASNEHRLFVKTMRQKVAEWQKQYPSVDFTDAREHFT